MALWILAAATSELTNNPGALQTWGPWGAVIIALVGREGVAPLLTKIRGKPSNGNGKKYVDEGMCLLRHQEEQKRRDDEQTHQRERHQALLSTIEEIQRDVKSLLQRD